MTQAGTAAPAATNIKATTDTVFIGNSSRGLVARRDSDVFLLDSSGGAALVASRDVAQVDAVLAALPPSTRQLLDLLSPEAHLARIEAPIFLVHRRQDPVVPFSESLRLERAARSAGRPARLTLVGAVNHVEGGGAYALADAWRLWATFYAFRLTGAAAGAR